MITLQLHKRVSHTEENVGKPSTIYAQAEVYTSASLSTTELNEEITEEERISQMKILRKNEQIRKNNTKQRKYKVDHDNEDVEHDSDNVKITHKRSPPLKKPLPFPSFKPLVKNFFIIEKQRNDTLNHL